MRRRSLGAVPAASGTYGSVRAINADGLPEDLVRRPDIVTLANAGARHFVQLDEQVARLILAMPSS